MAGIAAPNDLHELLLAIALQGLESCEGPDLKEATLKGAILLSWHAQRLQETSLQGQNTLPKLVCAVLVKRCYVQRTALHLELV